jgi:hypothetical protein
MQYFTVIAEKAARHIPDNNNRNTPHNGTAQQSRIICINLKVGNENLTIKYISFISYVKIFLILTVTTPFDVLVMTYAGVQLFLNMPEHILRDMILSLSLLLTSLNPTVLL